MGKFRQRTLALAGLGIVALVLLAAWWYPPARVPSAASEGEKPGSRDRQPLATAEASSKATITRKARNAWTDFVLPPASAPLEMAFDELAEAADAGHAPAACRLAWDLARCSHLPAMTSLPQVLLDRAAESESGSGDEAARIDDLVQVEGWVGKGQSVCAGLSPAHLDQAPRRMYQAAELGHAASMARFALWPPFGESLSLDDAELALAHRTHAMDFLRTAAASGEPVGLWGLFITCQSGEILTAHGAVEVGRDPVCALATASVLRRFADASTTAEADQVIREATLALDGQDRARAQALATRYEDAFHNQSSYDFASGAFREHLDDPCAEVE